ncbi:hypothetical protein PHMEG_00015788 [Phytophthora megakarya]|uniref:Uncharacterized protein n=1 Tax=Phytophthora megakarya TaxID=4795 RepID=A0A225W2I4_9STRA|nr:hypothetical protein PHMEG_00015788 [Phytophthora megakarya]
MNCRGQQPSCISPGCGFTPREKKYFKRVVEDSDGNQDLYTIYFLRAEMIVIFAFPQQMHSPAQYSKQLNTQFMYSSMSTSLWSNLTACSYTAGSQCIDCGSSPRHCSFSFPI